MEDMVERVEYRGFDIKIYPDDFGDSPRDWDNLGTMFCCHRNYELGDKQFKTGEDALFDALEDCGYMTNQCIVDHDVLPRNEFIEKYMKVLERYAVVLPLFLYDHSGITMSTQPFACRWDSGQVGFIYVTRAKILTEYTWKCLTKQRREKIEEYLQDEVNCYDQHLTGDVYGYNIEATDRNKEISCDDACWGYYGHNFEANDLLVSARASIDYAIQQYKEEVIKNKKRQVEMRLFMQTCWAY